MPSLCSLWLNSYSYLNASTGSNFEAFIAGIKPERIVTAKVTTNAQIIAIQGVVNAKPIAEAIPNPIKIPKIIPTIPPICPIIQVSVKNCQAIVFLVAPSDFRTPISLVRSETETNMMFINAIEEPKIVIIPITQAEIPKTAVLESNV